MGEFRSEVERIQQARLDEIEWHQQLFDLVARNALEDQEYFKSLGIDVYVDKNRRFVQFIGPKPSKREVRTSVEVQPDGDRPELLLLATDDGGWIFDWADGYDKALAQVVDAVMLAFDIGVENSPNVVTAED